MQSSIRRQTNSITWTQEQNHSDPDRSNINHLTHSSGTVTSPDFNIKLPIKTPKAGDNNTWNNINRTFKIFMEVKPIYLQSDPPDKKLEKLNSFTYSFFETEYGCRESNKKKTVKRQNKNDEKKKLRRLKRELKREWKKGKDCESVHDLKKKILQGN